MLNNLATACRTDVLFGATFGFIMVVACVFLLSLIIISLLRIAKSLGGSAKEQKLIRMEMGALADEVKQLRRESNKTDSNNSS